MVFWRSKKAATVRRPGLTGSGEFITNVDFWLWDDAASPRLIDIERFSELRKAALAPETNSRLNLFLISNSIVGFEGRKRTSQEETVFSKSALSEVNKYLENVRANDFDSFNNWLSFDLMSEKGGAVSDQHGRRVSGSMISVVKSYINCLNLWGFEYNWKDIFDSRGNQALLITSREEPIASIPLCEIQYIRGKPYRFTMGVRGGTWSFVDEEGRFFIFKAHSEPILL